MLTLKYILYSSLNGLLVPSFVLCPNFSLSQGFDIMAEDGQDHNIDLRKSVICKFLGILILSSRLT